MIEEGLARPRVDFNKALMWAGGSHWRHADYIKQGGVVFQWDDEQLQYIAVAGALPDLEWKQR